MKGRLVGGRWGKNLKSSFSETKDRLEQRVQERSAEKLYGKKELKGTGNIRVETPQRGILIRKNEKKMGRRCGEKGGKRPWG